MTLRTAGIIAALLLLLAPAQAQDRAALDFSKNCTDAGCHDAYAKRRFVHGPVASDSCDGCHESQEGKEHRFKFVAEAAKLCEECHDEHEGKVRHAPVAEGQCTDCHDPHASDAENLLKAKTTRELCTGCHDDFGEAFKFLHGPTAAGVCTACHDAHASEYPTLLVAEGTSLCETCHTAMKSYIAGRTHKHDPVTEGCTSCHDPHGADNRMNLKAEAPALCTECHDDIGEAIENAAVGHDAMTAGRRCLSCHDPHASNGEQLLTKEPMAMCLACHQDDIKTGKETVAGIGKLLDDNPNHHGPIRQKNCTACHKEVHGGDHFRLLLGEYPPGFYAPFDEARYAFCFECHEADLVRNERTNKLTSFRNGDHNLHYVHVNKKVKGRTCRACHSTHASRRPKHLTETVPFGTWNLPVNFEKNENGGSCLPGCHKSYSYDRIKPVVNISK